MAPIAYSVEIFMSSGLDVTNKIVAAFIAYGFNIKQNYTRNNKGFVSIILIDIKIL